MICAKLDWAILKAPVQWGVIRGTVSLEKRPFFDANHTFVSSVFSKYAVTEVILNFCKRISNSKNPERRDACQALSISRPTLYKLTNEGALKRVQISPGRVGWPASEIKRFIETRLT